MSSPYSRAPHFAGASGAQSEALNAALLIDFDNVTMGMRSDLSKELNHLLNSDIIKGKVTVQRAYADWRRYPQYIVPLSENSVDLIFAPAYGSSKKNATDIRMAIDAIELVFIRPEIGTFILLTGDSDFSSLVLKLKEYGKYVIGVGIQESSSDILVQNCDEYYSYTSLTGLRKTTDSDDKPVDPWVLVEQAAARMASRDDVMRSDRLKQVMIEIDPTFNEGNFGFSKFSRFLSEAGSRGLVELRKLENGQYEVLPSKSGSKEAGGSRRDESRKPASRGRGRGKDREERSVSGGTRAKPSQEPRPEAEKPEAPKEEPGQGVAGRGRTEKPGTDARPDASKDARPDTSKEVRPHASEERPPVMDGEDPLKAAYRVLRQALSALVTRDGGNRSVRDSDLKRKMLQLEPSFDEGELGFGKFSRFLRQAHDHEIVDLEKRDEGTYQVSQRGEPVKKGAGHPEEKEAEAEPQRQETAAAPIVPEEESPGGPTEEAPAQKVEEAQGARRVLGVRRGGGRGRKGSDGPPPLLEGQVVGAAAGPTAGAGALAPQGREEEKEVQGGPSSIPSRTPRGRRGRPQGRAQEELPLTTSVSPESLDLAALGLPTEGPALVQYLTHSYKGVGQKTAERLVDEFGIGLFEVLHREPERLGSVIMAKRVDQLLLGWKADLGRRLGRMAGGGQGREVEAKESTASPRRRTRKGTRGRGGAGGGGDKPAQDPS
ncbi:MAG: NYN domain-containing protein [Longimicrobiales bacterium]|nr:NYN domain-containing protein [Longimicrobiales bacterium]